MKVNNIFLIFINNKVIIYHEKEEFSLTFPEEVLAEGLILDSKKFLELLKINSAFKKTKKKIIGDKLYILKWPNYSLFYQENLTSLFGEFNFNKITFLSLAEIFEFDPQISYIFLFKEYCYFYYCKEQQFFNTKIIANDNLFLLKKLKQKYKIKTLITVQDNLSNEKIKELGKKLKLKCYMFDNNNSFLLDLVKKYQN